MSDTEYTSTTDEVREEYGFDAENGGTDPKRLADFDRWLADHDKEVRAEALAELERSVDAGAPHCREELGIDFDSLYCDLRPGHAGPHHQKGEGGRFYWSRVAQ